MSGRRVLFLRTFSEDEMSYVVLNSLALALDHGDQIEVVGEAHDRQLIHRHWHKAFGVGVPPESRIDFLSSTSRGWRRFIHERIASCDAIVLHVTPKEREFPPLRFAAAGSGLDWETYMTSPLSQPSAGPGLLREIAYINRLRRWPSTLVVCERRHQRHIEDLIAFGGMMGDAFTPTGRAISPRLMAMDKQIGFLRNARYAITFDRSPSEWILPDGAAVLRQALDEHPHATGATADEQPGPEDLLGASDSPRRLPPDDELKIVAFANVEDVFFLPSGEITQVAYEEMLTILDAEAVETGCPYCRAQFADIFFYLDGLWPGPRPPENRTDWVKAKCQRCGRKSSVGGYGVLMPQ